MAHAAGHRDHTKECGDSAGAMKSLGRRGRDQCDFDAVQGASRDADIKTAVSNSFGFGGTNAALVMRKL